jgi:DNA-binding HxlR family transcriptional regulator
MRSYGQYCSLALALDHVGDRWTLLIVRELMIGPKRFVDLAAGLPGIASNLLSERLSALEAQGLATKRLLPPPAAATVYELSEAGAELAPVVQSLMRWGGRFMLTRDDSSVFQPPWLSVALNALCPPPVKSTDLPLAIAVETPDGSVTLQLDTSGVCVVMEGGAKPDVIIRGPAPVILGYAFHALDERTARAALEMTGAASLVRLVWSWLSGREDTPAVKRTRRRRPAAAPR